MNRWLVKSKDENDTWYTLYVGNSPPRRDPRGFWTAEDVLGCRQCDCFCETGFKLFVFNYETIPLGELVPIEGFELKVSENGSQS